jgi:hypothetical protein
VDHEGILVDEFVKGVRVVVLHFVQGFDYPEQAGGDVFEIFVVALFHVGFEPFLD